MASINVLMYLLFSEWGDTEKKTGSQWLSESYEYLKRNYMWHMKPVPHRTVA